VDAEAIDMKHSFPQAGRQSGVMLIEALIALLIFSIGILGIVGLQASAAKASGDAKYRSDASLLANELIGRMWASDRTQATLQTAFASPNGVAYQNWAYAGVLSGSPGTTTAPAVGTVLNALPGAAANLPTVVIVSSGTETLVASNIVTITVSWKAPNDTAVHNYVAVARIGG
jgi:type IV pilus assembly protein PilV